MNPHTTVQSSLTHHLLATPSVGRYYGLDFNPTAPPKRALRPGIALWSVSIALGAAIFAGGMVAGVNWQKPAAPQPESEFVVSVPPKPAELILFSPGEQDLTSSESTACQQLLKVTRQVAGRLQAKSGATLWTEGNAIGAHAVRDGRFREFYVDETDLSRTLWFRSTNGPKEEFPRKRISYHFDKASGKGVVVAAVYSGPGAPTWLPKDVALEQLRESVAHWANFERHRP